MIPLRSPFAFIASVSFVASVIAVPLSGEPLDPSIVIAKDHYAPRAVAYINDHHEEYGLHGDESLAARAVDRDLRPQLNAAMDRTANLKHFFWTGWTLPGSWKTTSVKDAAGRLAKSMGGITLEDTVKDIKMPDFQQRDKTSNDTWEFASSEFAAHAKGDVYQIQGDETRPNNVWISFEFDRLKRNPNVPRIWRIDMHSRWKTDPPYQIWPKCADFEDRALSCPSDANLYHGSMSKPRITCKTNVAKEGEAKVIRRATASGIPNDCHQLIDGKMVKELMQKAGACTANANINKQIRELLSSARNRQKVQKARISKMVQDLDSAVVRATKFKSSPLDGLVAVNYYERTLEGSKAVAREIDTLLKTATGTSPGISSAWSAKIQKIKAIKATLRVWAEKEKASKAKQAPANQQRNNVCGGGPAAGLKLLAPQSRRMERRFSPLPVSSLEARVVNAPRSGAKAPAAPACPLKSAPPKKTVPRSKVTTKAPPAKKPREPTKAPARKPVNPKKKVATRPANRARRTPGKTAPRKRTTPKRKPKVVPKPTRRPKGKPRSRKRKGRK